MTSVLKWGSKKGGKPQFQESGSGKTWLHPAETLQQGSVVYSVKFLGLTDVAQAKGTEIVREAIKKVKFANHIKKSETGVKGSKLKKVEIKISIDNIKVEDAKMKEPLYSYPLHRISYCADDKRDKKLFAFIAKDSGAPHHSCYVFECDKMAEELTLTVGQAFDLAYRRFLEKKALNQNPNKKLTEMEEKIKTAEEEKEALKQKIAELEIAAKQGPPSSNGSNEGSQSQSDIDEFDLLGSFGSIVTIPGPLPQDTLPQETATGLPKAFPQEIASQEMIFDPFADSPPLPQTAAPMSPDFNEFSPQPVVEPVPRPTAKGLGLLPPPPTKESVKAANRMKTVNSGNVTAVTSPTTTTPSSSTTTSPLAPSDDLLQVGSSAAFSKNPFSSGVNGTNPFSDHVFDPLDSKDPFFGSGKEINQNIQGYTSDLVLH